MTRVAPIFDIPVRMTEELRPLEKLLEALRDSHGRLTPILNICHHSTHTGLGIVAGSSPGTALGGSRVSLDAADPRLDSVRLLVYGQNSSATPRTVQLYDVTNSLVLASLTMTNTLQLWTSSWTEVAFKGGERFLEVRAIGNGAETQTFNAVHSQWRTARYQQR